MFYICTGNFSVYVVILTGTAGICFPEQGGKSQDISEQGEPDHHVGYIGLCSFTGNLQSETIVFCGSGGTAVAAGDSRI